MKRRLAAGYDGIETRSWKDSVFDRTKRGQTDLSKTFTGIFNYPLKKRFNSPKVEIQNPRLKNLNSRRGLSINRNLVRENVTLR